MVRELNVRLRRSRVWYPVDRPSNGRFPRQRTSGTGRVRESGAVGSRHSIGLRCPMATASIELALWKPPRHAHAAGYVCTTLRAVIGVTISLAPG